MASEKLSTLPVSSPHRLPTVSAANALTNLAVQTSRGISTGLAQLDKLLAPPALPRQNVQGGLRRGKVTEVYGPSGSGKTALGMQAAASTLRSGQSVVWVEGGAPLVLERLSGVLAGTAGIVNTVVPELLDRFRKFTAPTLAHLLALFMHSPPSFPPSGIGLIVIDSLSTLIDDAYPRTADRGTSRNKTEHTKWAAGRKLAVINELISTLTRFAAMHDIVLLVACQTITRIRSGSRALLVPAISSAAWEKGISTRVVLFRDWVPGQGKSVDVDAERLRKARFAGLVKVNGTTLAEEGGVGNVVPFVVESTGLYDISDSAIDIAASAPLPQEARPPKRRFTEIDDSEDEDPDAEDLYGWVEDDEVAAEGLLIDETDPAQEIEAQAAEESAQFRPDPAPGEGT